MSSNGASLRLPKLFLEEQQGFMQPSGPRNKAEKGSEQNVALFIFAIFS
jgi:hypothetical protein